MTPTKSPNTAPPSAAATTTSRTAPTRTINVNGTRFAYRELGQRTGVPVIFLHHLMAVLDDWDPRVIDGIAAKRHVITFDNRGVGGTGGSVPKTVEEMADDAAAFIRALGHNQVDLLGFSLGGGVAQSVLLRHPELVRRAILAGTGPAGAGGLEKMPLIAGGAYLKAALTLRNPKHFLFFPRTPNGKLAATDYMARLKERTTDRDKGISLQARRAQLKAIVTAGGQTPYDLGKITHPPASAARANASRSLRGAGAMVVAVICLVAAFFVNRSNKSAEDGSRDPVDASSHN